MNHEVMVVDANAIGMIAVLRSLGRAGYKPHAVSARADALGFKSRFAYKFAAHPSYDSSEFIPWLRDYLAEHPIHAIVCGEEFLHAINDHYADFEHLIPDSPPDTVRQLCLSKVRVWRHLVRDPATCKFLPQSGVFENVQAVESFAALNSEEGTYYLKMDKQHGRTPCEKSRVVRVSCIEEMRETANSCFRDYSVLSWQRHVPGLQVGVSLWRHNGDIVAENMVLGLHLYPFCAGNMSLRKTWWHEGILADAKIKIAALNWSGVAMVEYKWNPETDEFWYIEMNPRFWSYLHLDLSCGKDFPKWQTDAHFGEPAEGLRLPQIPRTMRYAPGEVIHVASLWLAPRISVFQKIKSLVEFVFLSLNPKVHADLWFSGDKLLYIHGWIRFLREIAPKAAKAFRRST